MSLSSTSDGAAFSVTLTHLVLAAAFFEVWIMDTLLFGIWGVF
jgi:hypothetical protein